jgi:hypothetical protein
LKERLSRLEQREIKKRQLVLESMAEIGDTTLEQQDFTLSVRAGAPSLVVVVSESEIPSDLA